MAERRDNQRQRDAGPDQVASRATKQPTGSPEKIAKLAGAVGNGTIQKRIEDGNASRDMMLAHLGGRLTTMRELQRREIDLSHRGSHFPYWRQVADANKPEYSSPEPTRWHEAARLYEAAAHHLCQGDLKRGRDVLERAMAEDQRARESLTVLVFTDDIDEEGVLYEVPAGSSATEVAGSCDLPPEVALAREIYHVTTEGPEIPNRRRPADPWWTMDEDEEEEEPGGAGGP